MPNLTLRPLAKRDLAQIWRYIAKDSELRADAFIDHLNEKLRLIAKRPMLGRNCVELGTDIKRFSLGRYIVFYMAKDAEVEIIRVLHSARNYSPDDISG